MYWWTDPDNSKHAWDFGLAAVGALVGTATGAWVALRGERKRREKEIEDRRVEAANVAIFALSQIANYVWDFGTNIIGPMRSSADRWYFLSGWRVQAPAIEPFDAGRLAFLFETAHKNLPIRIATDFTRFEGLLHTIRSANETNARVQQLCSEQRPLPPESVAEIEALIGVVTKQIMERLTDGIIDFIDKLGPSVKEAALALRDAVHSMYPHRTIIHFTLDEADVSAPVHGRQWPWPSA